VRATEGSGLQQVHPRRTGSANQNRILYSPYRLGNPQYYLDIAAQRRGARTIIFIFAQLRNSYAGSFTLQRLTRSGSKKLVLNVC
jgi:hypothetical protein